MLVLVLGSSTLKIALLRGDSGMSLNFPFIFLAILRLSPAQALLLGAISMAAQCRIRTKKTLSAIQVAFNVASTVLATGAAAITFLWLRGAGLTSAPALSVASVTYFLFSTISVALVVSSATQERPFSLWKNEFPWYLPFYLVGAALAVTTDIVSNRFGWGTSLLLIPMVYTVFRAYNAQIIRLREHEQHFAETEALHLRTIEGLSMAIEAKDHNTHEHLFRVRDYVQEIGQTLNLSALELQALHTAAFLHDIGKLAVPEQIINKPGKLTPEEFDKMKIHPVVGADILERVRFPYPVVPIVRSHHEWWDGSGYPDGLKGEEIPLGARILSAADCFDALVSDRPYRNGLPVPEALAIIRQMSGTQFDPRIVDLLTELHERRVRQEDAKAASTFTALKTDFEVRRGDAPAAGFEGDPGGSARLIEATIIEAGIADSSAIESIGLASAAIHALYERSLRLQPRQSLEDTLCLWAAEMRHFVRFDACALFVRDGDRLSLRHADGFDAQSFSNQSFPLGDGISGWVAQSGKSLVNGNAELEVCYRSHFKLTERLKSALAVPLLDLNGNQLGVLTLYSTRLNSFEGNHLRTLKVVATKTAMLLQQSMDTTDEIATESWTEFYKQMSLEVSRAERSGEPLALLVCGLGQQGRMLYADLQNIGSDLVTHLEERGCPVGRIGENEFVLLLRTSASTSNGELEPTQEALRRFAHRTSTNVSMGVASFPEDAKTVEELIAIAEARAYLNTPTVEEQAAQLENIPQHELRSVYESPAVA